MPPFRRIVFPVDYSDPCKAVTPYVRDMRQRFSASLTLVHAYSPEALAYSELAITNVDLPEEVRRVEEERLRAFARETFPEEAVETVAQPGEPAWVVTEMIGEGQGDLIMLPTHGRGPVRRLLLGSVTTKILHDVHVPVWTGIGSVLAEHSPGVPYKSMLCAVDYNVEAEKLLKAAQAMAKAYDARLSLVHVVETPAAALEIDFALIKKELVDTAEAKLVELKERLGIDGEHSVIEAPVAEGVHAEAVRRKADLIITGRGHAQAGFTRLWSLLYPIIRQSPCPVLSI